MYIYTLEELENRLDLTEKEKNWTESDISMPLKISDYYFNLIDPANPADPIRRQCVPNADENICFSLVPLEGATSESTGSLSEASSRVENSGFLSEAFAPTESIDPLNEVSHSHGARLIHRYKNRVAFLATDFCASYCRHCFRRRFTKGLLGPATQNDIQNAAMYIHNYPEIKEMLLTGGDPLTISDDELDHMIGEFRSLNPALVIRICTRMPVVEPGRITPNLVSVFTKYDSAPFFLMTQFNHPRELTEESVRAVRQFVDAGIPAFNQSVLLKGVNDNADTLEELCNKLLFYRIKPYYLFQTDLVYGTSSFRVPIERGMEIERELRERLSGLSMPAYTLDLPDGGGKVPLCGNYVDKIEGDVCYLHTLSGEKRLYPSK